eukprot:1177039-Prorocentrum_minimum.AAC.2
MVDFSVQRVDFSVQGVNFSDQGVNFSAQGVWISATRGRRISSSRGWTIRISAHLDDLYENSGAVAQRLGEDLEQDPLVVLVHQDAQLFALRQLRRGEGVPSHL